MQHVKNGRLDAILLIGDISYADEFLLKGTKAEIEKYVEWYMGWFETQEPVFSSVPLLVAGGNHEAPFDFTLFKELFTMPDYDSTDNLWWSLKMGPLSVVAFSSEHDLSHGSPQIEWLTAAVPAVVAANPNGWVIAAAHRPMYCTAKKKWCYSDEIADMRSNVEPILHDAGVRHYFCGHVHSYQATFPIYNNAIDNETGIYHILTGAAGCHHTPDQSVTTWEDSPIDRIHRTTFGNGILSVSWDSLIWEFWAWKDASDTPHLIDTMTYSKTP